jgi:hypothetical protein
MGATNILCFPTLLETFNFDKSKNFWSSKISLAAKHSITSDEEWLIYWQMDGWTEIILKAAYNSIQST